MTGQEIERAADLLGRAYADGELSEGSTESLRTVGNIASEVGNALGVSGEDSNLLLVTILVDDSSSILDAPYGTDAVCLGHNLCLDVLQRASGGRNVRVHTRYLNEGGLSPYLDVAGATRLSPTNYRPAVPKTPLFRQTVLTLGAVFAKVREEREQGSHVRAFTLLLTDGSDNASGDISSEHVRFLVQDMLNFSDDYIVAGMGIGSPDYFRRTFSGMGIPKGWVLTPDATAESIERVFREKVEPSLKLAAGGDEAGWAQLEAGPPSSGG
jgi:hypothetical protein